MRIELPAVLRKKGKLADLLGVKCCDTEAVVPLGIATHSDEVRAGDLFVALQGSKANGAAFALGAVKRGAVAVLCDSPIESCPMLICSDPAEALLNAAAIHRRENGGFLVAISGSAGKTTVKEAVASMLELQGSVAYSKGNFNSMLGFPLSMLSFSPADFWVVELGINHPDEMEPMARAAAPDLAVLTNVGSAHIGNFRDRKQLLEEKTKIAVELRKTGKLLVPASIASEVSFNRQMQIVTFGEGGAYCLERIAMKKDGVAGDLKTPDGVITNLVWPLAGKSGVAILETVGAVGHLMGLSQAVVREGLRRAALSTPRMRAILVGERCLIDDGYNASPEAMIEAVSILVHHGEGRSTVAVLGDMLELGAYSEALHRRVGAVVAAQGLSLLITYGDHACEIADGAIGAGMPAKRVFQFAATRRDDLIETICRLAPKDAMILFKASAKMEFSKLAREVASKL
ncbi:MAG: UDP-N-acetylmuramoyl-tripeptide--D-alanyl-D-alanine ligase [Clostridia bacterium]|nr:UDP-N-acetylmuramoyl-tripeptide--D-alanyl-D-alanine ligase [Clostridia bacterium]